MATIRPRGLNVSTGLEEVSLPTDTLEINNIVPTADATINTSVTTAQTLKLRGYNLTGATYSDFFTVTAGNTATANLNTAVTIGSAYIYRAGGTDVPVADGGTGLSSATAYAVLCGGTTSTGAFQSVSGVGTAGQVLTSNGASALPTWQDASGGGTDPVVLLRDTFLSAYTDDLNYILAVNGTNFRLFRGGFVQNLHHRYTSSNAQSIAGTSLLASANTASGLVVGGYAYAQVGYTTGSTFKIYRIATSGDISSAGNWTDLTLSGASFSALSRLIGHDGTNFWLSDGSQYFKATISGTTLTEGSSVSVTGSSYSTVASRVNSTGIYASFAATPSVRKADLSGSLAADEVVSTVNAIFCTPNSFYASNGTTEPFNIINV